MMNNTQYTFELFNDLPGMYFLVNKQGQVIKMDKKASVLLGEQKIKNNLNFFDLIELCDREKSLLAFKELFSHSNSLNVDTRLFIQNKYINVDINFTPPGILNGTSNEAIVIVRDITEQRSKENNLQRFYDVVENSINPVQITDISGKMIYVNPAFEKTSGYSKDELIGQNPRIFGSGKLPRKFWDKMWQTISTGKTWFGEIEDRKKNGEPYYTQLLVSPFLDSDGKVTGYFGIHKDASEKRTLEHQLINTQKMESIGTLAAGIAHEVGNPLASISALVQVVQRNTKDDFISEKLGLVKNQITRISKIIRDLVDFSRPSNFELKVTNINSCLEEAVEITKVGTKAKTINFYADLDPDIPRLPLIADQIEQVFVNILLNAVDALNESGKPDSQKQITVSSEIKDDEVIILISDTGTGIAEKNLSKIFEPFFTTKEPGKGTGLGLWVSYGIIKSFLGDLTVSSKPGKGTSFKIILPIQ